MSIVRVAILLGNVGTYDASWDFVQIAYWNSIEVNSAIVVSCLIVLKPLFRKLIQKVFPASDQSPRPDAYPVCGGNSEVNLATVGCSGDVRSSKCWETSSS